MKHYLLRSGGIDHTVQCSSDAEAARRGYRPIPEPDPEPEKPKASRKRTPANKAGSAETK